MTCPTSKTDASCPIQKNKVETQPVPWLGRMVAKLKPSAQLVLGALCFLFTQAHAQYDYRCSSIDERLSKVEKGTKLQHTVMNVFYFVIFSSWGIFLLYCLISRSVHKKLDAIIKSEKRNEIDSYTQDAFIKLEDSESKSDDRNVDLQFVELEDSKSPKPPEQK